MEDLPPTSQERRIVRGNEPLLLDDPEYAWIVETGSLAVFAVALVGEEAAGPRRYLVTVGAGEAAFGMVPDTEITGLGLLGSAIEETVVQRVPVRRICHGLNAGEAEALALLESWVQRISSALLALKPSRSDHVPAGGRRRYSLSPGETFVVPGGTVLWAQILEGQALWMGLSSQMLGPESGITPLGPGMWLQAETALELVAVGTLALGDMDFLLAGLVELPPRFLGALGILEERDARDDLQRLAEHPELDRQRTTRALDDLASLLVHRARESSREGSPLLLASRIVGKRLGVGIRSPRRDADRRPGDPVEAIATASNIRCRRVRLEGQWWRYDCGPLLGSLAGSGQPVALLPLPGGRYEVQDPASGERWVAGTPGAPALAAIAHAFCRTFPAGSLTPFDILKFTLRDRRADLATLAISGIAGSLLGMLSPLALALLVDVAIPAADEGLLLQLTLGLLAAGVGGLAFQVSQWIAGTRYSLLGEAALQAAIWDRLLGAQLPFFRRFGVGDLQVRMTAISQVGHSLSNATLRTLFGSLFSLLNLFLMLAYSPPLALVAVGIALSAVAISVAHGMAIVRLASRLQEVSGRVFGLEVELVGGVSKLRVAEAEAGAFAHWANAYRDKQGLEARMQRIADRLNLSNIVVGACGTPLLFFVATHFGGLGGAGEQHLSTGIFLAFYTAFGAFMAATVDLSNLSVEFLGLGNVWRRAKVILDAPVEMDVGNEHPGQLSGRIALDHLTFRYRPDGPAVLSDVTLSAEPGECIAIVGPSGSGKSTLIRMLLGFERPETGAVLFDGRDLARLDVRSVRRQIGVVLQSSRPLNDSIFKNISAGSELTLEQAWEAACAAGLAEDIEALPMGMETVVSEGGSNLSGGQRQRLLIARALAWNPRILVFDEATSALDNQTQAIVTESLRHRQVTRIVIAHRLSTIRDADRIYVLQDGRVVQQGSFVGLASEDGLFARLAAGQTV